VTNGATTGLCRLTVVAPTTRVDLALPDHVPVADMVPTLLRYAGPELAEDGVDHNGWALARLGGDVLDTARTLGQLGVRDGEQLYLTPRGDAAPPLVFDDVVDALATGTRERGARWTPATTRTFALATAAVALLAGAGVLVLSGPPHLPGALAGLAMAVALVIAGTTCSRAFGESQAGALLGLLALPYAFTGGLLVLAGDRDLGALGAAHVLAGAALVVLVATAAALAVADLVHVFAAAALAAVALALAALVALVTPATPAGSAAVLLGLALALTPVLPAAALRLARVAMPSIPTSPEDLKDDTETVDGRDALRRGAEADRYLTGLLLATGTTAAGALAVLAAAPGWSGPALAAVAALALLVRARVFRGVAQRLPLLVAGLAGLALLAAGAVAGGDLAVRLGGVFTAVLVTAAGCALYGLAGAGKRPNPLWGRALDLIEVLLVVGVVPLVLAVCGLYGWVRGING
jgi:type VII secretion integral membrane protein EccD